MPKHTRVNSKGPKQQFLLPEHPNSKYKVLLMLGRIVFLAKPSNFQERVLFIAFFQ
jgi:hypothetical protein